MNHAPQKSDPVSSTMTPSSQQSTSANAELEIECIDLVCKLEHELAVAKEGYRDDQVAESAATSERMLRLLVTFSDTHLQDDVEELQAALAVAFEKIAAHRKVISKQSWTQSLISVFFDSVDENAVSTHAELGKSMAQVCATVFVSTIQRLGAESNVAKQVQQSMELFVEEFTENW